MSDVHSHNNNTPHLYIRCGGNGLYYIENLYLFMLTTACKIYLFLHLPVFNISY